MTLDFAEGIAHRGGHGAQAGFRAGLGVHGVHLRHHARALRREILALGLFQKE
jgi:hypothetical protein